MRRRNAVGRRRASSQASRIGQELVLAQSTLGLTTTDVARLAHVAGSTVQRLRNGHGGAQIDTLCAVAGAVGLELSLRAFPARPPSLRDTGQLEIATLLTGSAHQSWRHVLEMSVGDSDRSADLVFLGAEEILHVEIERLLLDFQAQYRAAVRKRDLLAAQHRRPVRLVLAVEDLRRNRERVSAHRSMLAASFPANSRDIMSSLRGGHQLGRDGLLWIRRRSLVSRQHR